MSVFCPNCGKPNTDSATKCVSCGTELKPAGGRAGKFKGTMMMSGVNAPPPPQAGGGAAPPGPPPASGGPVQAGSPQSKQNMAFQKTMLGPMTPPGAPPAAPPAPSAPRSAPPPPPSQPAPGGFGQQPAQPAPGGFGQQPAQPAPGGFGQQPAQPAPGGFGEQPSSGGFGQQPAQPSSGGFGEQPSQPSSGGFGEQPSSGGFGQQPSPGGFGGGAEASQPGGGGFGQQPSGGGFGGQQPAGGGFGGQQPPAGGGGFGGPPGGGSGPTAAPPKKSKKPLIFIGLGCLFLSIIGCAVGGWLVCSAAEEGANQLGSSFQAEAARIPLTFALGGIKMSCMGDPSGAGTASYIHSGAAAQLQGIACQVGDDTIDAFSDANRSQAQMLSGSEDESRATALGLDPSQCTRFTSGSAKIVGCTVSDTEGWKIVHMENLQAVQ